MNSAAELFSGAQALVHHVAIPPHERESVSNEFQLQTSRVVHTAKTQTPSASQTQTRTGLFLHCNFGHVPECVCTAAVLVFPLQFFTFSVLFVSHEWFFFSISKFSVSESHVSLGREDFALQQQQQRQQRTHNNCVEVLKNNACALVPDKTTHKCTCTRKHICYYQ